MLDAVGRGEKAWTIKGLCPHEMAVGNDAASSSCPVPSQVYCVMHLCFLCPTFHETSTYYGVFSTFGREYNSDQGD